MIFKRGFLLIEYLVSVNLVVFALLAISSFLFVTIKTKYNAEIRLSCLNLALNKLIYPEYKDDQTEQRNIIKITYLNPKPMKFDGLTLNSGDFKIKKVTVVKETIFKEKVKVEIISG